jgi:hypothetical protein
MDKAQRARDFLDAARAGDIATALALVTATAVHHNMYFAADMTVLIDAIQAGNVLGQVRWYNRLIPICK